jgi:peptidoglycan/xylan/chitin deacetylase (PgdA/CDA1 family)
MKPTVVLTFDGEYGGQYTYAYPYLQERGLIASFYLDCSRVGQSGWMTVAQIKTLRAAGHEIGVRTYDGTTYVGKTVAQVQADMAAARAWFASNTIPYAETCGAPQRYWTQGFRDAAAAYYRAARVVNDTINHVQDLPPSDVLWINNGTTSINSVYGDSTPAIVSGWLDELEAAGDNHTLILLMHGIVPSTSDAHYMTTTDLAAILDDVQARVAAGYIDNQTFNAATTPLAAPTVAIDAITSPTTTSSQTITGTMTGDSVTLTVNGLPISVVDGLWSTTIDLLPGVNNIAAEATSPWGNATATASVEYTPVEVPIEQPSSLLAGIGYAWSKGEMFAGAGAEWVKVGVLAGNGITWEQ